MKGCKQGNDLLGQEEGMKTQSILLLPHVLFLSIVPSMLDLGPAYFFLFSLLLCPARAWIENGYEPLVD